MSTSDTVQGEAVETVASLQAKLEKSERSREKLRQALLMLKAESEKAAGVVELLEQTQAELASTQQRLKQEQDARAAERAQHKVQLERANSKAGKAGGPAGKGALAAAAAQAVPVSMASNLEATNRQLKQEQAEKRRLQDEVARLTARLQQQQQQHPQQGGEQRAQHDPAMGSLPQRVAQLEQQLEQARASASSALTALDTEREQRKSERATAAKELAALRRQLKEATAAASASSQDARRAQQAAGGASASSAAAAAAAEEVGQLRAELQHSRAEAIRYSQELVAAKEHAGRLQVSLQQAEEAAASARERADSAQHEAATQQQRLRKLQAQHKQLQSDVAQLQAQLQGGLAAAAGTRAAADPGATAADGASAGEGSGAGVAPELHALKQQMASMAHMMADLVSAMDHQQRSKLMAVQLLQGELGPPSLPYHHAGPSSLGMHHPTAMQQSATYDLHATDPLARVRASLLSLLPPQQQQQHAFPSRRGSEAGIAPHAYGPSGRDMLPAGLTDAEGSQGSGQGPASLPLQLPAGLPRLPGADAARPAAGLPEAAGGMQGPQHQRRHPGPHEQTPDHSDLSASTSGSDRGLNPPGAPSCVVPGHAAQPQAAGAGRHVLSQQGSAAAAGLVLWPPSTGQPAQLPHPELQHQGPRRDSVIQGRASFNKASAGWLAVQPHAAGPAAHAAPHTAQPPDSQQHLDSSKGSGSGAPVMGQQGPSPSPSPSPSPHHGASLAAPPHPHSTTDGGSAVEGAQARCALQHGRLPAATAKATLGHTPPALEPPIAKRQRLMQGGSASEVATLQAGAGTAAVPAAAPAPAAPKGASKRARVGRPPKPRSGAELLEPVLSWQDKPATRGPTSRAAATAVRRAAKAMATALRSRACTVPAMVDAIELAVLTCTAPQLQAAPHLPEHEAVKEGAASGGSGKASSRTLQGRPAHAGNATLPAGLLIAPGWGGWCLPDAWSAGTVMLLGQAAVTADQELAALDAKAAAQSAFAQAGSEPEPAAKPLSVMAQLFPQLAGKALTLRAPRQLAQGQGAGAGTEGAELEVSERCALLAALMHAAYAADDRQAARGLLQDTLHSLASHTTKHCDVLVALLYAALSAWPHALLAPSCPAAPAAPATAQATSPAKPAGGAGGSSESGRLVWDPLGAALCAQITQVCLHAHEQQGTSSSLTQELAQGLLQVLAALPQLPVAGGSGTLGWEGQLSGSCSQAAVVQAWRPALGLCLAVVRRALHASSGAASRVGEGWGQEEATALAAGGMSTAAAALLSQAQAGLLSAGLHLPFALLLDDVLLPLLSWQAQAQAEGLMQLMSLAATVCHGQLLRARHVPQLPLPPATASRCLDVCDALTPIVQASLLGQGAAGADGRPTPCPPAEYLVHAVVVLLCCVGMLVQPAAMGEPAQRGVPQPHSDAVLRPRLEPATQLLKQWARRPPVSTASLPEVVCQLLQDLVA